MQTLIVLLCVLFAVYAVCLVRDALEAYARWSYARRIVAIRRRNRDAHVLRSRYSV